MEIKQNMDINQDMEVIILNPTEIPVKTRLLKREHGTKPGYRYTQREINKPV